MKLLEFLWAQQRAKFVVTTLLLLAYTFFNIYLLGIIGRFTTQLREPPFSGFVFALLALLVVGSQTLAILLTNAICFETSSLLRQRILTVVVSAPLAAIEKLGRHRVVGLFIDDVERVRGSMQAIVNAARDVGLILGVFGYLAWLSPRVMAVVVGVLAMAAVVFALQRKKGIDFSARQRTALDRSYELMNNLLDGIKQIGTSETLRAALQSSMRKHATAAEQNGKRSSQAFTVGIQSSILAYFAIFLILTYANPDVAAGAEAMGTFVIALLVVLNPLISTAFAVEQMGVAGLSLARIDEALATLRTSDTHEEGERQWGDKAGGIQKLEVRNLYHSYHTNERQEFVLGPVAVTIRAAECLFIVGGNGTGKTTLLKLITGLYTPSSGEIRVNDIVIDSSRRKWLRHQFSTVFNDSCLFESLRETEFDDDVSRSGATLLDELKLTQAISRDKSILAQAASCSSGERRRVALLLARLVDRPIYIFDEYGADQDPENKSFFYDELLPQLKARGKIVIVVTHDDRYFDRAEQVLQLDRGLSPIVRRRHDRATDASCALTA